MHGEFMVFMGWAVPPLVAYVGARILLTRTERRRGARPAAPGAEERLEQLRRWRAEGRVVPGGRMADAVRMAQEAETAPAQRVRQS